MNKAIEDSGVSLNTDLERLKIICRGSKLVPGEILHASVEKVPSSAWS